MGSGEAKEPPFSSPPVLPMTFGRNPLSRRSNPNSTCIWNCQIQPGTGSAQKHPNGFFCHVRRHIGYSFLLAPGRIRPGTRYDVPTGEPKVF